ncbi:hypothetical protein [Pseudoxanthomonas sp.]|uniref:hypothetical protein n=1 Tax=Pseudoxanthomonas sp. TaxID=1871049 RepID=UPI003F8062B5
MAGRETIPEALAPMVEPGRPGERGSYRPTLQWYDFLNRLASSLNTSSDQQDEIADIQAEIERIQEALTAGIVGPASVRVLGSLSSGSVTLQLVNDQESPAAELYYGTDASGAKGFHSFPVFDHTVPYAIPDGETYTVRENKQAPFTIPIDIGLGSGLIVEGILVEVD